MSQPRVRVVLASTDETGMGHLARQAAIALALPATVEPVIFSPSRAIHHVVANHRLRAEYCAGRQRSRMPHRIWDDYVGQRLSALLDETRARVLVFDGAAPCLGLLRIRSAHPDVAFAWVRGGMRRGSTRVALAARSYFDTVIVPGDIGAVSDLRAAAHRDGAAHVPPVSMMEHLSPLDRTEAAAALGLDPDRPAALVTLGASPTGDTIAAVLAATSVFLSTTDWQVAVTCRPQVRAGLSADQLARIRPLDQVYPLARYLAAFDAAVATPSYNTVHELLPAGMPTVLVPPVTAGGDREARARHLAMNGVALCAQTDTAHAVARAVRRLLDPDVRATLRAACADLETPSGASATAALVARLAVSFAGRKGPQGERARSVAKDLRAAARRALGPVGANAVRRALRRPAGASHAPGMGGNGRRLPSRQAPGRGLAARGVPGQGSPLRGVPPRPLVTNRLDPDLLCGEQPVEHVLPESSAEYRNRRLAIAREFYQLSGVNARLLPLR